MLIAIQYPIIDLRKLLPGENYGLPVPEWPDPEENHQFVRAFGEIVRRPKGGLHTWIGEHKPCHAKRILRFKSLPVVKVNGEKYHFDCAFRRFYFDGRVVGKYELGLTDRKFKYEYAQDNFEQTMSAVLNKRIQIYRGNKLQQKGKLYEAGDFLATEYHYASTFKNKQHNIDDKIVLPGKPAIIVDCDNDESIVYNKTPLTKINIIDYDLELYHAWLPINDRTQHLWILKRNNSQNDPEARYLRLQLFRINAELESLKTVSKYIRRKIINIQEVDKKSVLYKYLTKTLIKLVAIQRKMKLKYNPELADEAMNCIDQISRGEFESLYDQLGQTEFGEKIIKCVEEVLEKQEITDSIKHPKKNLTIKEFNVNNKKYEIDTGGGDAIVVDGDNAVINYNKTMRDHILNSEFPEDVQNALLEFITQLKKTKNEIDFEDAKVLDEYQKQMSQEISKPKPDKGKVANVLDKILKFAEKIEKATPIIPIVKKIIGFFI